MATKKQSFTISAFKSNSCFVLLGIYNCKKMQLKTSKPRLQLISNKTKKIYRRRRGTYGKTDFFRKKTQIISFSLPVEMNEFYIEGLLTAKFIPSIFFCQQILLGLKNNVLNNWRVMVKIRPSTEEIEMHDLYSTDYGRMISRFRIIYVQKHNPNQNMGIPKYVFL